MAVEAVENGVEFWLLCRVGRRCCGLALDGVVEIMRPLPIEAVAGAPSFVRGLAVVRGAPVPVVDMAALLGESDASLQRMVTVRAGNRRLSLLVGSVIGVRAVPPAALGGLPPLLQEAAGDVVSAIGVLDAELLLLLGTGRMLPEAVLASLGPERAAP